VQSHTVGLSTSWTYAMHSARKNKPSSKGAWQEVGKIVFFTFYIERRGVFGDYEDKTWAHEYVDEQQEEEEEQQQQQQQRGLWGSCGERR
jgi:hypothetical protein